MQAAETINVTLALNGDHITVGARQRGLRRPETLRDAALKPSGKISIVWGQTA